MEMVVGSTLFGFHSKFDRVIKVLHLYKSYLPDSKGGVEQVIFQLASKSRDYGVDATVLSLSKNKAQEIFLLPGHAAHRAKLLFEIQSCGFSLSFILKFIALAKDVDIVHCHFPWPFMDLVLFLCRCKKPIVLTYHSDIIRQKWILRFYRPLKKWLLKKSIRIVPTSPNYVATSEILKSYHEKVEVIPIGIDENLYPVSDVSLQEYWGNRLGKKFYIFVGVLRYYKGLEILLEALAIKEFPVVIVGSGPMEQALRSQAQKLNLKKIIFLGYLSDEDKVALLKISYGVLFPSHLRSEAFGVSLLEGAMFAKPLISSEIGTGTSYININGETGLVIERSNPQALQNAMNFLWENQKIAEKMGLNARTRYLEFFTGAKMIQSYSDLYSQILKMQINKSYI